MVFNYEWKRNMAIPAQKVGEQIERLEKRHGEVTARVLLDDARNEKSCLHRLFEWDDAKAAENYRLRQATFIIQNLTVKVQDSETPKNIRAYVNIKSTMTNSNSGVFVNVLTAMNNEEMRRSVLLNAMRELLTYRKKYSDLVELQEVFEAIGNVNKKLIAT